MTNRLNSVERENNILRAEMEKYQEEIDNLKLQKENEREKNAKVLEECARLQEKIKELEEKLEKERKRNSVLEIENARAQDEIKKLKKDKIGMSNENKKDKTNLIKRIKDYFNNSH